MAFFAPLSLPQSKYRLVERSFIKSTLRHNSNFKNSVTLAKALPDQIVLVVVRMEHSLKGGEGFLKFDP